MTGEEKARETAGQIRKEVETKKQSDGSLVRVERSTSIAPVRATLTITGLEEVPVSMIPLPFYKLVQPGSTNTTLSDGKDAIPGTFFLGNSGKSAETIRFALLRAKRMHRNFTNDEGEEVRSTSMAVLGIDLESMIPFMINVSVASFSNFGRMLSQLKEKEVEKAWQYPIVMTTEKREEVKNTPKGAQKVKWWEINFAVENKAVDELIMKALDKAYEEFAAALDRNSEVEIREEPMPFQ